MKRTNFEFKARVKDLSACEEKLLNLQRTFIGEDRQRDTYFNVSNGRLKLREGNIENALIYYERQNAGSAKQSDVLLYKHPADESLKEILTRLHGIKVVVDKIRKIYFIDNVKFHFDTLQGLGTFVEVEAIDSGSQPDIEKLKQQCSNYAELFGIKDQDYVAESYSDLIDSNV